MDKTLEALRKIRQDGQMTYNSWTFRPKGNKFVITKEGSTESRVIPERALQRILNNIL